MGSNLVIVAVPDEDDRVWKVSSEKVPHLTLLFLGDSDQVSNLDQIVQFVEHAADTSLRRFYLPVDRRGELGADKADVLFFKKGRYDFKAIRDFRSLLLKDSNIKTAYDSTTQFETPEQVGAPGQSWIPHLTLGYPETPAKPMPDEYTPTFYDVNFTKIAVWVGNYDGPEFTLKDYYEEWADAVPMDVAMSDLEHYGVKGMQWGVRRRDRQFVGSVQKMDKAKRLEEKSVEPGTGTLRKNFLQRRAHANRVESTRLNFAVSHEVMTKTSKAAKKDLAGLRKRPEFQNINYRDEKGHPKFDTKKFQALEKEESRIWIGHLNKTVEGQQRFDVEIKGNTWNLTPKQAKHADESVLVVRPIRDEDGYLIDVELVDTNDSMAQTIDLGETFVLEHYGIKGMHWGQRRQEFVTRQHQKALTTETTRRAKRPAQDVRAVPTIGTSKHKKSKIDAAGGEDHPPTEDAITVAVSKQKLKKSGPAALTNIELAEMQRRLNLENDVLRLTSGQRTAGQRFVDGLLGRGSKDDRRGAENQAGQAAQDILKKHGKKKFAAKAASLAI